MSGVALIISHTISDFTHKLQSLNEILNQLNYTKQYKVLSTHTVECKSEQESCCLNRSHSNINIIIINNINSMYVSVKLLLIAQ